VVPLSLKTLEKVMGRVAKVGERYQDATGTQVTVVGMASRGRVVVEHECGTIGFMADQDHWDCVSGDVRPEQVATDKEILIRALSAAEEAKDFAYELLAIHDTNLGRTLKRHRMMAEELEKSIQKAKAVQIELRSALGWSQRETR
jgi:hypothetical protein